jgi:two-component system, cell cycle sensor histidine kinase and response regulator CckA
MTRPFVVLVADDDVLVRNLIHAILTRSGYSVLMAADGEEALELSRRFAGEIHLLLSDVTMPRMDDFRLVEQIREERPTTRALLISGKTSSEILAGNVWFDFLHKPFVPEQLKAKLLEILSRSPDGVEEI